MSLFDEPSRQPLPQAELEDVRRSALKGMVGSVPLIGSMGAELLDLVASPLSVRRDAWLEDLARRLLDLESKVPGFVFDDLAQNEQFISATLQATQAALRTHQADKLEALRNAVLNVAAGKGPSDDMQMVFLSFIDSFAPAHIHVLCLVENSDGAARERLKNVRALSDQAVRDLNSRGLIDDTRPYLARGRETTEPLVALQWKLTPVGKQFLAFIRPPEEAA